MTLPDALTHVGPGEYLGEVKAPTQDGAPVDVAAVYEGIPEDAQSATAIGEAKVFTIRPVTAAGDELTHSSENSVIAAIQGVHTEGYGYTAANLVLAASGSEAATDTLPVFKDEAEFRGVIEAIAHTHHLDRLDIRREDIRLSADGTQMLGSSATGQPDVVRLELQNDQELAPTAFTFPS